MYNKFDQVINRLYLVTTLKLLGNLTFDIQVTVNPEQDTLTLTQDSAKGI